MSTICDRENLINQKGFTQELTQLATFCIVSSFYSRVQGFVCSRTFLSQDGGNKESPKCRRNGAGKPDYMDFGIENRTASGWTLVPQLIQPISWGEKL